MQFVEAYEDNLDLLLDLVEVIRSESTNADDEKAAMFFTGLSQIVRAFRAMHGPEERITIGEVERLWSAKQP